MKKNYSTPSTAHLTSAQMEQNTHVAGLSVLPSNERHVAESGVRALLRAVFHDGVKALRSRNNTIREEAMYWLKSPAADHPFSFVSICEALDLSPSATRKSILKRQPQRTHRSTSRLKTIGLTAKRKRKGRRAK